MNYTISVPPGPLPFDASPFIAPGSGIAPLFAHVRFESGFVYGMIGPAQTMGTVGVGSDADFAKWLSAFVNDSILPELDRLGRKDSLVILSGSAAGMSIEKMHPYPKVASETRKRYPTQAIVFYMFPPMWIGSSAEGPDRSIDFQKMSERVFTDILPNSRIKVAATRDGQFIFDFTDWPPACLPPEEVSGITPLGIDPQRMHAHGLRVSVVNAFLTCLRSACSAQGNIVHSLMPITIHRIHHQMGLDRLGGGGSCRAYLGMDDARKPHIYQPGLPHAVDWRIADRSSLSPIPIEHLQSALQTLDSVLMLSPEKGLQRVLLYGHACTSFEENNFPLSLGQAWLACESLLSQLWDQLPKNPPPPSNNKKKTSIQRPKISEIIKQLVKAGVVSATLFDLLDPARIARNNWIHELVTPPLETAEKGLTALEQLMEQVLALKFVIPHWPSGSGHWSSTPT